MKKTKAEIVLEAYRDNPKFNRKLFSEETGICRTYISDIISQAKKHAPSETFNMVHEEKKASIFETNGNRFDRRERQLAKVTDKIVSGVVCCTFGWWQGCPQLGIPPLDPFGSEGANFSLLVNGYEENDPISGSIPIHGYLCSIKKAETAIPVAKV